MSQSQESTADGATTDDAGGSRIDRGRATSIDMDANVAAALGYLFSYIAAVVVLVGEEENEFVRFHVFQSTVFNALGVVVWSVLFAIGMVVTVATLGFGAIIVGPLLVLAMVPILGYIAYAGYRAYQGERYEMAYIADFVEQYV